MNNKYIAKEGYLFDYKEPRYHTELNEEHEEVQVADHLGARIMYLGVGDNIDNYIEVKEDELFK